MFSVWSIGVFLVGLLTSISAWAVPKFTCTTTEERGAEIRMTFSDDAEIQLVEGKFTEKLKSDGTDSILLTRENSDLKYIVDDDKYNPSKTTWLSFSEDIGNEIRVEVFFQTTDFRGRKYSLTRALVGQGAYNSELGRYVGKLTFRLYNGNFPAWWATFYTCTADGPFNEPVRSCHQDDDCPYPDICGNGQCMLKP